MLERLDCCTKKRLVTTSHQFALQYVIIIIFADLYLVLFSDKKVGSIVGDLEVIENLVAKLHLEVTLKFIFATEKFNQHETNDFVSQFASQICCHVSTSVHKHLMLLPHFVGRRCCGQ